MVLAKINNKFFNYYIFICLVTSIFFLYHKFQFPTDWTTSEWLINYQGGFTRRGLVGEILVQINSFLNFEIRNLVFIFEIILLSGKYCLKILHNSEKLPGKHSTIEGLEHVDKAIIIDQSPIGRTPRSNPATYTKVFDEIRKLFSNTTLAKERGYTPGTFSFNVKGGRCEACSGAGSIKLEMNFLPDVWIECDICNGKRYTRECLEVTWKGKTIHDVLQMPVGEAVSFFKNHKKIHRTLETLNAVGLAYIRLGQPATTLSGGEAQRVKLSRELSKRDTGNTLYILDEPTTGLHFEDIRQLLDVLHRLRDGGNTVVIIEHNLDVIKTADWIVDLGPEGGSGGGQIVATGTPEQVAENPASHTGTFLAPLLPAPKKKQTKPRSKAA